MSRVIWLALVSFFAAGSAFAQAPTPNLVGTWKGQSEGVVYLAGNEHNPPVPGTEPKFVSLPFTLTIQKQEGRQFYGTFSSAQATETIIGVISHTGTIHVVDNDGMDDGVLLAPDRVEFCYKHLSTNSRIVACTEFKKQP